MPVILLTCAAIFVTAFLYSGNVVLGVVGIVCLVLGSMGR